VFYLLVRHFFLLAFRGQRVDIRSIVSVVITTLTFRERFVVSTLESGMLH